MCFETAIIALKMYLKRYSDNTSSSWNSNNKVFFIPADVHLSSTGYFEDLPDDLKYFRLWHLSDQVWIECIDKNQRPVSNIRIAFNEACPIPSWSEIVQCKTATIVCNGLLDGKIFKYKFTLGP